MIRAGILCLAIILGCGQHALSQPRMPQFDQPASFHGWSFPRDHGAHPRFQTEWWYLTGQLFREGRESFRDTSDFGFQLTFFRRARRPEERSSGWDQSYLAHAALAEFRAERFVHESRAGAGGLRVAGASEDELKVWSGEWRLEAQGEQFLARYDVGKGKERTEVELMLTPKSPPVLHGTEGVSRKGACAGCESLYYSYSRLAVTGYITRGGVREAVSGLAWFDHEIMSNALGKDQTGWDWLSLIRKDGSELMVFRVRGRDGTGDFISGTFIRNGTPVALKTEEIQLVPGRIWKSGETGARYPVVWKIAIPRFGIEEEISALLDGQELVNKDKNGTGPTYWEGAVASRDNATIGYLEMTGYAAPMGAAF